MNFCTWKSSIRRLGPQHTFLYHLQIITTTRHTCIKRKRESENLPQASSSTFFVQFAFSFFVRSQIRRNPNSCLKPSFFVRRFPDSQKSCFDFAQTHQILLRFHVNPVKIDRVTQKMLTSSSSYASSSSQSLKRRLIL